MTFDRWSDRIAAAGDTHDRRALLAEVATWRAQRLSDIGAAREATWAMARLYALVGEHESAVREARSLVSLCQTPPEASDEEYAAAEATLVGLGEAAPRRAGGRGRSERGRAERPRAERPERPERPRAERPERPERPRDRERTREAKPEGDSRDASARDRAMAAVAQGDHTGALRGLRGRRGPAFDLLRTWIQVSRALAATSPEDRERDLRDLEGRLRRLVAPEAPAEARPERAPKRRDADEDEGGSADDPLSQLLGRPAPRRRERRIEAMDAWLEAHPDRIDDLAAAALAHHAQTAGLRAPAPWLAGYAAWALARDGARTREAVAELERQDAFAVTAYREPPFGRLVDLLRSALGQGWTYAGLRRGVMARGEPGDRKLWTLRLMREGDERMAVVGPSADEAYAEGTVERLADRIGRLCPRSVLLASGPGNEGLRAAADGIGIRSFDQDPGDEALLEALAAAEAVDLPPRDEPTEEVSTREPRPPREERPLREERPPREEGPRPDELLAVALEQGPDVAALVAAVERFPRPFKALQAAERLLAEPDDARTAAVLEAVDRTAPAGEVLPEGTTLAVRAAAAGGERSAALLVEGSTAARFGGAGVDVVIALARELASDGWETHRVLRGATRRERRSHPALETLDAFLQGVWRLLVRRGEARGEVWYVADLPVEGRAALPQLLLEDRQRAVVMPIDPDLLAWYGTLSGPEAIGWTGDEGEALRSELGGWTG